MYSQNYLEKNLLILTENLYALFYSIVLGKFDEI